MCKTHVSTAMELILNEVKKYGLWWQPNTARVTSSAVDSVVKLKFIIVYSHLYIIIVCMM